MNDIENGIQDLSLIQDDAAMKNPEESIELSANIDERMGVPESQRDESEDAKDSDEKREAMGRAAPGEWDIDRRINDCSMALGTIKEDKCIRCNVNTSKC